MTIGIDIDTDASLFDMKVMHDVLTQGYIVNINPDDMVEFFAQQVQLMLACPPNYNKFGEKARVWVMRGFYPGSTIFFKIVVIGTSRYGEGYYAKVSIPVTSLSRNRPNWTRFQSATLNERMTLRMENAFLNGDHIIPPLMIKELRMPRCMSPKGCKIFTYKEPRRIRNEKSPGRKNVRKNH